jgi:hypothetical protein
MEEEKELTTKDFITCEFCKEYQGTPNQVKGHRIHCRSNPAREKQVEVEPTTTEGTPLEKKPPSPVETRDRRDSDRKKRIPFGVPSRRLKAPEGDGFQYRVFNDNWHKEPGRINRALEAGYEVVDDFKSLAVGTNDDGSAIKGVLMRIPKELYDEDQKLKMREIDNVDKAIKGGTIEQQASDKRYIPQGIKIWSNQNESG